jgi:predicted Zn-dependent protease
LRDQHFDEAKELYLTVAQAKALPWSRQSVASTQLDSGHPRRATTTLENLVEEGPSYVDAYDLMGRAQFEQGKRSEMAMTLALKGNPQGTVEMLLGNAAQNCNARVIESSHQVLQRYGERIPEKDALQARVDALRERFHTGVPPPGLGEQAVETVSYSGISLPAGYKPPSTEGLLFKPR